MQDRLTERFYIKELDNNGAITSSIPLPCKPKKIIELGEGVFLMMSFDGLLYYKHSTADFTRLYLKKDENDLFEETLIDIYVSRNNEYIIAWTDLGYLVRIETRTVESVVNFFVRGSHVISQIPIKDRSKYRIARCPDDAYTLVNVNSLEMLDQRFNLNDQNSIKKGVYKPKHLSFWRRMFHETYRLLVNRPLKITGLFLMGFSLFLYMKYLKKS